MEFIHVITKPEVLALLSLITSIAAVVAVFKKPVAGIKSIQEGQKCLLRSQMLSIYYKSKDSDGKIRQYEYENFCYLYQAYKSIGGNSFIDKIYDEIKKMEVIT